MKRKLGFISLFVLLVALFGGASVDAQGPQSGGVRAPRAALGTAFTYQGQLKKSGSAYTGACDFTFGLWDAAAGGTQLGSNQSVTGMSVSNGLFTVQLNGAGQFGANAFNGNARYLDISAQCAGDGSATNLGRQSLTVAPYASYAVTAGNANLLDGLDSTAFQRKYQNVVIVAKSGGDYTSIQSALNSITTASASNRYLVWVAPGTYSEQVTMKPYVDIEGAGELPTKITYWGGASLSTGTVVGANNAELRFLTVENTGVGNYAIAIYNGSASPRLTHVTATGVGGSTANYGVYNASSSSPTMTNVTATAWGGANNIGVYNFSSSPTMTNVTATALGGSTVNRGVYNSLSSPTMTNVTATASGGSDSLGVYNFSSSPTMTNVTATASGGTANYGVYNSGTAGTVTIHRSTISGTTNSIYNATAYTVRIGASQLVNAINNAGGGTFTCVSSYNSSFATLNASCN